MDVRGELQIDPGSLDTNGVGDDLEIVVPYMEWSVTQAVLKRAAGFAAGLNARLMLVAIHTVPYPAQFECQAAVHAHLVEQLVGGSRQPLPPCRRAADGIGAKP